MKSIEYICDLCDKNRHPQHVYAFAVTADLTLVPVQFDNPLFKDGEKHVCKYCVKLIKERCEAAE